MAHQAPGEAQVVEFGAAGLAGTHHLPAVLLGRLVIEVLHQQSAQQAAQLHPRGQGQGGRSQFQEPQVGLGRQQLARLGAEGRRHHAFQEQAGELAGRGGIHQTIEGDDAAEGRDPIGIKGPAQGPGRIGPRGHATGIGVLDDHGCR